MISPAAFYGFAGLAVVLAVATIVHRNLFKSATLLAGFFFSLAALFITLDAEFLAVVQILIYVGAITVLIVFAVMLTSRINDEELTQFNSQRWLGVATGLGLLGVLAAFLMHAGWGEADGGSSSLPADPLALIGTALMSDFILAFDLVTVLLLVALLGALYIARQDSRLVRSTEPKFEQLAEKSDRGGGTVP